MKRKTVIILMILYILTIGIITSYKDSARVRNGIEPKYTIKIVNKEGSKVTYWGLGYKVIRFVGVSPKEPFANNIGVRFGSWFMEYELPVYWNMNDYGFEEHTFMATIIEVSNDVMIVEPEEGTIERTFGDRFSINIIHPTSGINDFYVPGNKVKITYDGLLVRTYPVQINTYKIELYTGDN